MDLFCTKVSEAGSFVRTLSEDGIKSSYFNGPVINLIYNAGQAVKILVPSQKPD